ncbi:MAG TPA: YkgJ family cysteine cluster protein [Desulfobacterales bacterium]|nr:YkgJ family cysteine cluster protein [Desulfobacterales bacterium]
MKQLDVTDLETLPGIRLRAGEPFRFRCHPGVGCFNRCCRNLNLFLYPYDLIRLKTRLGLTSDEFLDRHVDVVLRPGSHFPDVLLRMADNAEKSCPFLTPAGCSVYPDRPDTCRTFPLEQGLLHDAGTDEDETVFFFRPPDFCLGRHEEKSWTVPEWVQDQEAGDYHRMTIGWAELRRLFQNETWGAEGPTGTRGKMAFMAAYNVDRFREFVFDSSFLKRFKVKPELVGKVRRDDVRLMRLGFDWIELFVWGIPSSGIKPRGR